MATGKYERKLAAILYADVAGYSCLTGENENEIHSRLSEYLDVISQSVEQQRGRVIHYAGDAVLATRNSTARRRLQGQFGVDQVSRRARSRCQRTQPAGRNTA